MASLKRTMAVMLMIALTVCYCPTGARAAEEKPVISTGVPGISVIIKYSKQIEEDLPQTTEITETLKTDSKGDVSLDELYTYCIELGWDEAEDPDNPYAVNSIEIEYEVNYPDKTAAEKDEEENGNGRYSDAKGTFTLTPEDWLSGVLVQIDKVDFVEGEIVYKSTSGKTTKAADKEIEIGGNILKSDSKGKFSGYPDMLEETYKDKEVIVKGDDNYNDYNESYATFKNTHTATLEERDSASKSEYSYGKNISDNGYVKTPGTYEIIGNGTTLSLTQDGEYKSSVDVSIDETGTVSKFYVKRRNGDVTKPVENIIKLDQSVPVIEDVEKVSETEGDLIKFLKYGIFTKELADITVTATISDTGSGVEKIYLVGKNKQTGKDVIYYPVSTSKNDGQYDVAFEITGEDLAALERVMYIVSEDKVGNKSDLKLVRPTGIASTLVIEKIKPAITEIKVAGTKSKYGWYSTPVTITFKVQDSESGLYDLTSKVNGDTLLEKDFTAARNTNKNSARYNISSGAVKTLINTSGKYESVITATDNAGNVAVATKSVKIDMVKPIVKLEGIIKGKHYSISPTLKITNIEKHYGENGAYIKVNVVRDGKQIANKTYGKSNSLNYSSFMKDGNYKVTVWAVDAAGNKSVKQKISFVKDSTRPEISIKGASNNGVYKTAKTISISISERYYKTNKVKIDVIRKVRGNITKLSFPWSNDKRVSIHSRAFTKTGEYTVKVYATDEAGNKAVVRNLTFTVDVDNPQIKILNVTNKIYGKNDRIIPAVNISDDFYGRGSVTLTKNGNKVNYERSYKRTTGGETITYSDFPKKEEYDGIYKLTASATDKAGNTTTKTVSFSVNKFGSTYKYNKAIKDLMADRYVQKVTKDLVITEYNVSKINDYIDDVMRDGSSIDVRGKVKEEKESNYIVYTHTYKAADFADEGVYSVDLISKDQAGNAAHSQKKTGEIVFTVDKTAPSVILDKEIENKAFNAEKLDVKAAVKDNLSPATATVFVNGKQIQESSFDSNKGDIKFTIPEGRKNDIKIVTKDLAGNERTVKYKNVTVSTSSFVRITGNKFFYPGIASALILAGVGVVAALKRRKKK